MLISLCPMIPCNILGSIPASAILVHAVCRNIWAVICGSKIGSLCSAAASLDSFLLYALVIFRSTSLKLNGNIGVPFEVIKTNHLIPSIGLSFTLFPRTKSNSFCFNRLFLAIAVNEMSLFPERLFGSST